MTFFIPFAATPTISAFIGTAPENIKSSAIFTFIE
jgi:hypothetical protein